jgi:serine/threonine-protein kinase
MLYERPIDQVLTKAIPGTESADDPFFSPDGKWIGFESPLEGKLMKVPLEGGPVMTISSDPNTRGATWGPDDNIIYAGGNGLFRLPASGETPPQRITQGSQTYTSPRVLSDGKTVLFGIGASSISDQLVGILSLETGAEKILLQGSHPHYAASGHLVFAREGTLMAVPFDLKRLEVTGESVALIENVRQTPGAAVDFTFSETGTLVYVTDTGNRSLAWVDREGKEEPLVAESRQYLRSRISPDGSRLALTVITSGNSDIWIYDLKRETQTRLTFDPAVDERPIWTPDGQRVVFMSTRGEGSGNLFWKASDGTGPVERLTTSEYFQFPESFTPDGKKLILYERNPSAGSGLHIISMEGESSTQPLLETPFFGRVAISPDGRWMAYRSGESGRYEVYVRPFPDVETGKWQISSGGGDNPVWNPGGREIFYNSLSGQRMMMVRIEDEPTFTPGTPIELFLARDFDFGAARSFGGDRPWDIFPNGQRFLMLKRADQTVASTQITVVLNWFEELKRLVPTGN